MWKPGADKPAVNLPKSRKPRTSEDGLSMAGGETSATKPKSLSKKRLSGQTMNMRFMKRKKGPQEQEEKTDAGTHSPIPTSSPKPPAAAPLLDNDTTMDLDDENDEPYAVATTVDMYGMQASLVGRRSFGGFNPHTEEVWKSSKASIENDVIDPMKRISDEELLKQYEDLVNERSGSSRPVGNLKGKSRRKLKR